MCCYLIWVKRLFRRMFNHRTEPNRPLVKQATTLHLVSTPSIFILFFVSRYWCCIWKVFHGMNRVFLQTSLRRTGPGRAYTCVHRKRSTRQLAGPSLAALLCFSHYTCDSGRQCSSSSLKHSRRLVIPSVSRVIVLFIRLILRQCFQQRPCDIEGGHSHRTTVRRLNVARSLQRSKVQFCNFFSQRCAWL